MWLEDAGQGWLTLANDAPETLDAETLARAWASGFRPAGKAPAAAAWACRLPAAPQWLWVGIVLSLREACFAQLRTSTPITPESARLSAGLVCVIGCQKIQHLCGRVFKFLRFPWYFLKRTPTIKYVHPRPDGCAGLVLAPWRDSMDIPAWQPPAIPR